MGGLGEFLKKRWGVVILLLGILAWASDIIGPGVISAIVACADFIFK